MLLDQFARWLHDERTQGQATAQTIRAYMLDARAYLQWLADQHLAPILTDETILQRYSTWLLEKYAASTTQRKFASLRRFYEMEVAYGHRVDNPATQIKITNDRAQQHAAIKIIPPDQLQHLLQLSDPEIALTAREKVKRLRDRAMLLLMIRHGLGVSEVTRLNLPHLRLEAEAETSSLRVPGNRHRWHTVYLVAQTQSALEQWLAVRSLIHVDGDAAGDPLFASLHWADNGHGVGGRRLSTRGVRVTVDRYLDASGAKAAGISCQALRHSFATWAVYLGADVRAIRSQLGQTTLRPATHYDRLVGALKANPAEYLTFLESPQRALKPRPTARTKSKGSA
jgi:site-specific recombinase XerD